MTIKSRIFTILTIITMLTCTIIPANASQNTDEYIEYTETIYFDNINVAVKDNKELLLTASNDANVFTRISANRDINILNEYFEKYEDTEVAIAKEISNGSLYALSYTETPLTYNEDHYERVRTTDNSTYTEVDETLREKYNFSLSTAIIRTGEPKEETGEYTYYGLTAGEWSDHSIWGGKKYPASGMDYIAQTITDNNTDITNESTDDNNLMISGCALMATYLDTNPKENEAEYIEIIEGISSHAGDYLSLSQIGTNLVQYEIKDDPFGDLSLSSFLLTTEFFAQAPNTSRQICSAYTHTWLNMSVDASFEAGAGFDVNIGESSEIEGKDFFKINAKIALVIDPTISTSSWTLFSFTAFNF